MRTVATRIRTLFIPCTLALIFGILLFQTDRALMKGGEKQRLSNPSTPQSTTKNSATNRTAFTGSTLNAASANTASAPNAFFAPAISASKSVNLASASPGATLNYTVTIGNAGADPALGVSFMDTIDANTTLVPGSVNTSPLALNDAYASIGNVGITVPAASGVLANDFDPDGTIPAIIAVNTAGTQGTVSLNLANGSFTFNPNPGFEGTTMFTYTISDGALMDTGLVSITVSGMIWFVDDSVGGPGDGRLSAPFNSIANFNSLAADDPGDNIFLYSGSYSGALALLNNQKLIGEGATASLASITGLTPPTFSNALPGTGGARPTITNSATLLSLGQGNTIRGFNVTNTAGTGITGTSFGNLTASEISVTSSTCTAAVSLTTGNPTASFTAISAANCSNGIKLSSTTGSFTVTGDGTNTAVGGNSTGGTISNMSGADNTTTGIGVYLDNVQNVTLRRMAINGTNANYGIRGNAVNGFTLEYSTISGTNGTNFNAAPNNAGEGSIYFGDTANNGISTSGTFTNNNISGGAWRNVSITNTATGVANVTTLTFKGNTFGLNGSLPTGNQSLAIENRGTATINSIVGGTLAGEPNTFTGSPGDLINFTGQTGSTMDVVMRNNSLSNNHPGNIIGGGGLTLSTQGVMTFHVTGNTMRDANGSAVTLQKASAGTLLSGFFDGNTIGVAGVADSGSKTGNGIFCSYAGIGTASATITNNQIHQIAGNAHIYADNTDGSYTANFTIEHNTLDTPGAGWFAGIAITNGSPTSTDTVNVCAKIGGTTAAEKNTFNVGGNLGVIVGSSGATAGHTFNLPTYAGGANLTNVENFIQGNNAGSFTTAAYEDAPATVAAFTGVGTSCSTPSSLASPIEADEQKATLQQGGNNNTALTKRLWNWVRPAFSAFASPVSYVNLDSAFGKVTEAIAPAAKAAEFTGAVSTLSGETVTKGIAIIPPGKIVTITFSVTIDTPFPPNVCTVSNQGLVSGSNFSTVATNTATTTVLLAPTIGSCPTNISTNTDPGLCTAAVTFATPTATGCPSPTVTCSPASGSAFPKGTTTVTCTATNGVSPNSTCSFTVTVTDNQGPTFAGCPANISANTDAGLCTAAVTYTAPTATDVCDGARTVTCSPASGSSFPKGVTTVTCSASDTSGNSNSCSFTVTVADNQGPVLTSCPANISTNTNAGLCTAVATYTAPTANDACDGARTVTCSPASGTAFAKGVTTVTCSASDISGNNSSCSFTVTVADNQAPVVTCPGPISLVESPSGSGSATATFSATANDACDGSRPVTCTPASGSSFPIGVTTVTCSASDTSGNSGSCSFTVTVSIACTITCPSNVTANTAAGQCSANVTYPAPTTAAGCGTVTCTPASGSSFNVGTTTVTCSTTAGPSCSFTVTVVDNQAPTVTCPANVNAVTNNTSGTCSASGVSVGTATAVDNCGGTLTATGTRSDSQPLSAPYPVGTTTITWSATDSAGNTGSCTQTVTVTNPNPVVSITGPASGSIFAVNTPVNFTGSFTDNTGTHTATWTLGAINVAGVVNETLKTVTASHTFTTPGIYPVTLTVNDNCGGTGSTNEIGGISALVVIYDPNGGFVTGGGWIDSPAGAYVPNPSLTGKANFGFNAKYKNNGSLDSQTDFQFKAGNFHFQADDAAWLVVTGAKAQFQGTGTVQGSTHSYGFTVTVIDGSVSGGGGVDKFRISIWDITNGNTVVYDTQLGDPISANPTTPLGGGSIVIHNGGNGNGNTKAISDFDGDGKTDMALWDNRNGEWQIIRSDNNTELALMPKANVDPLNDVIVPGDYDGDGKTDAAVFHRSSGQWSIKRSSDGQTITHSWGVGTDVAVPADYDGDGKTDLAVWRSSEGRWYIQRSSDNQTQTVEWGSGELSINDVPVPADYDGDGKADVAVFRRSNGGWYIKSSVDGSTIFKTFGVGTDVPVPADYDGDGKTDMAVWRGSIGMWFIANSSNNTAYKVVWGASSRGDIPVPGDYDGDGKADIAVWRSSEATWFIKLSLDQGEVTKSQGSTNSIPVQAATRRQL